MGRARAVVGLVAVLAVVCGPSRALTVNPPAAYAIVGGYQVPARAVADWLGLTVTWSASAQQGTFTGTLDAKPVELVFSSARTSATYNAKPLRNTALAVVTDNRLYVPSRLLELAGLVRRSEAQHNDTVLRLSIGDRALVLGLDAKLHPLVLGGSLLGATQGTRWLGPEAAQRAWREPLRPWRLWRRTVPVGRRDFATQPERTIGDDVYVAGLDEGQYDPPLLAGHAPWTPLVTQSATTTLRAAGLESAVRAVLDDRDLRDARVGAGEAIRCDLDGDGAPEWVVQAHDLNPDYFFGTSRRGDYCFVAVLPSGPQAELRVLEGAFVTRDRRGDGVIWRLLGLWDLTGDGRAEVVCGWTDELAMWHPKAIGWRDGRVRTPGG